MFNLVTTLYFMLSGRKLFSSCKNGDIALDLKKLGTTFNAENNHQIN